MTHKDAFQNGDSLIYLRETANTNFNTDKMEDKPYEYTPEQMQCVFTAAFRDGKLQGMMSYKSLDACIMPSELQYDFL